MVFLHSFRVPYPKALFNRTKLPVYFVAPTHSHVVERSNDRSQTSTLRNRLKGGMQIPTGILQSLKGLVVKSAVDTNVYPKGIIVSDEELASVKLKPHDFHGEWNYTVKK